MSDTSSPLTAMSSPLSELSEPPGSPEPFQLPPAIADVLPPVDDNQNEENETEQNEVVEPAQEQPSEQPQLDISNEHHDLFEDGVNAAEENEVIILAESPSVAHNPIDLSNESPELIQNGNIVQVRWVGTEGEGDLIIEVDENGYEIQKSGEPSASGQQGGADDNGDAVDDDLQVDGERGVRSLLDHCRGIVMRCAARYDDIGDLQFQQHPLFFSSLSAKQLELLERNSPGIKGDTDHLWKRFVMQKSLPDYKTYEDKPPKSWRRVYKHLLREEERKILQAAEEMKASYAAEEMEKRARRTQLTSATLQDLGYRKKALGSTGSARAKPSLLGKVREKTMQERKFRAPPSLPSPRASTMESLIFPTSGPYATLGAFHPASTSRSITTKASKGSSLPAPPFVFPSHGLRQQIREASDHTLSATPSGSVAPRERLLKHSVPEDDSDSDEVTFIASSSSKGKDRGRTKSSPPAAVCPSPPPKPEAQKRKRPVDMDFFSVPSSSSVTSRQSARKPSVPKGPLHDADVRPSSSSKVNTAAATSSQTYFSPNRSEVDNHRASANPGIAARSPSEGSRNRLNTTLFVPKRRKVL